MKTICDHQIGLEAGLEATTPSAARPSTGRRLDKLQALLAELSRRDLDVAAAASFLRCSPSTARSCLYELRAAEVACQLPSTQVAQHDCLCFRATSDPTQIGYFLELLEAARLGDTVTVRKAPSRALRSGGSSFHILGDDVKFALRLSRAKARRDPLVAALFGGAPAPA
ncbi:hypothetical protein [Duganella sp. Dugasp56]|uniref:hypothetical protein n=1 Tax=Duganella sp. Dugasp56 TaxID=3243046 RepID=UPI0039AF4B94